VIFLYQNKTKIQFYLRKKEIGLKARK